LDALASLFLILDDGTELCWSCLPFLSLSHIHPLALAKTRPFFFLSFSCHRLSPFCGNANANFSCPTEAQTPPPFLSSFVPWIVSFFFMGGHGKACLKGPLPHSFTLKARPFFSTKVGLRLWRGSIFGLPLHAIRTPPRLCTAFVVLSPYHLELLFDRTHIF